MTTIIRPLGSESISSNLEDKSSSENGTDKIEFLPNTTEVSFSSSQSLARSNLTENITEDNPVTENKMDLSQEKEKTIDNSEDESELQTSTNSFADSVNNKNLESTEKYEKSNSTSSSKCEIEDNLPSQKDKENFSKGDSSSSNSNPNSQKVSQEKVEDESNVPKIKKSDYKILSSDDDDDNTNFKLNKSTKSSTRKMFAIVDSESDDDSINKGEAFQNRPHKSNLKNIRDSDSEDKASAESSDDENSESHNEKKKTIQTKGTSSVLKNLVDSDDSEADEINKNDRALSDASDENKTEGKSKKKVEKKRTGSVRAAKDAAMKEIHSESQRLLRESELSLPYHRPKQRTLQEFLNRKKIFSTLPKAPTTAAKVKMFSDIISKAVEEKEKEIEEFYKSSDSEEEMQLTNKETDGIKKPQDSTDQNLDLDVLETPMEVDFTKKGAHQLTSTSLDQPEILLSSNLNRSEEVSQSKDTIEEKTTETTMECSALNSSNVSRKLFQAEDENDGNSGTINHESEEDCEASMQNLKDQKDAGNSDDGNAVEADTNDFELRFSTADFDTNLELLDLERNSQESLPSNKTMENEKSGVNETEVSELATLEEERNEERNGDEKAEEDEILVESSKGHVIGLSPPDFDDNLQKKTLKHKIPSCYLKGKPTLQGSPGVTIDFELVVGQSNRSGINRLVDRFVRHSQVSKNEENADVMVMHTEVTPVGLKITESVLPYKRMNAVEDPELNKPGAKLKKLREELEQKMSSKRNEEWRQKEEASKALDEYLGEEIEPEDKDELLMGEEEELDDESAESEPEENDVIIKENKKSKCEFADEEAEVSEGEENIIDEEREDEEEEELGEDIENEDEEDNEREEDYDDDDDDDDDEDEEENGDDEENKNAEDLEHPKKLRRITTAFEDDSNLSEPENAEKEIDNLQEVKEDSRKKFERTKTAVDMFSYDSDNWTSDNEDEIHSKMVEKASLTCKTPVVKSNHLSLVSPLTQLTALSKNSNVEKKNSASKEEDSSNQMNGSLSQESDSVEERLGASVNLDKRCGLQKKLFEDSLNVVNVDDLMDLCSGKFSEVPVVNENLQLLMNPTQRKVTDSQLLDLCSGSFSSAPPGKEGEKAFELDENSQDIRLTLDEESRSSMKTSPRGVKEVKFLGSRLKVVSSDEEDEIEKEQNDKKGKRKIQKFVLSDDEDENEDTDISEEEKEEGEEEEEEQFVDYDSEENEVVMISKKDIKKVARNYLENEAELSESDWDSADEDEKDLDKLEREEGDDDIIDEDQMRNQLGKIHARQVLDDDQREVKLLQDMLFEDGDLHSEGAGRERKFKWKNIDDPGAVWDESKGPGDPEMIADAMEDTNEIELRKRRFEQQQFLEKQSQNYIDDIADELNDSPIFKVGLKVVNTSKSSTSFSKVEESVTLLKSKKLLAPSIIPNLLEKSKVNTSTMKYAMRGSFLARGEETLARIATLIDDKDRVVRAPVNGRRFLFEHVSPSVKDTEEIKTDEEVSISNAKTRKRTSTSDSTPKSAKKLKVEERSAGKKLFSA